MAGVASAVLVHVKARGEDDIDLLLHLGVWLNQCAETAPGSDSCYLSTLYIWVYLSRPKWQLLHFGNGQKKSCPLYYSEINWQDFWLRLVIKVKLSHWELPVLDTWDFRLFRSWFYTSSLTFAWCTLSRVSVESEQLRKMSEDWAARSPRSRRGSAWPRAWVQPSAAPSSHSPERDTQASPARARPSAA